ncbi:hypothetical protein VFPPC_18345 [Pochonia chlamydosporia 170]|uniref:Peptidase M23 n=1 Tax=Pochonia chlamydosporia 170 TaxID=1380566 RepID=A0A219AQB5_METCM|nr:hypothetical protein VFPPC_18345 [Pochonia chlamydosporia 170]OWT42514.1 hypothetical protein VFPPC_18345 [Pochonia chlamydosporia 170]
MKFIKSFQLVLILCSAYAVLSTPRGVDMKVAKGRRGVLPSRDVCSEAQVSWTQVDQVLGRTAAAPVYGVHRYSFPRADMNVTVGSTHVNAGFALGSFAAFMLSDDDAIVMGDLVLSEEEVNPVMSALQKGGIQTTAIHNHLLFEKPAVKYVHYKGQKDLASLARTLRTALGLTKTPLTAPAPNNGTSPLPFNTTALDSIIGYPGKANNGVYQYSIPRAETIMDGEMTIPPAMGVATAINFQPTGRTTAAITGDFVLLASEVPLVLQVLSESGIQVNALHNHMLTDSPRLFYIHFWAVDEVVKLGNALRSALARTNSKKPGA